MNPQLVYLNVGKYTKQLNFGKNKNSYPFSYLGSKLCLTFRDFSKTEVPPTPDTFGIWGLQQFGLGLFFIQAPSF
jgi:hypothetical protein